MVGLLLGRYRGRGPVAHKACSWRGGMVDAFRGLVTEWGQAMGNSWQVGREWSRAYMSSRADGDSAAGGRSPDERAAVVWAAAHWAGWR